MALTAGRRITLRLGRLNYNRTVQICNTYINNMVQ